MKTIQQDIDRQQQEPNSFYRFLLANRPHCELCSGPYPSTRIIKVDGHDTAVCDSHFLSHNPQYNATK